MVKSECDQTQKDVVISTYSAGWLLLEALFCPAQRKMFASNIQIGHADFGSESSEILS